jgi:hypothetical protein
MTALVGSALTDTAPILTHLEVRTSGSRSADAVLTAIRSTRYEPQSRVPRRDREENRGKREAIARLHFEQERHRQARNFFCEASVGLWHGR